MPPKNKSAVSVFVFLFSFNVSGMQSLLLNTLYLLRMVHEAGKNGVEDFKPIGKGVANICYYVCGDKNEKYNTTRQFCSPFILAKKFLFLQKSFAFPNS